MKCIVGSVLAAASAAEGFSVFVYSSGAHSEKLVLPVGPCDLYSKQHMEPTPLGRQHQGTRGRKTLGGCFPAASVRKFIISSRRVNEPRVTAQREQRKLAGAKKNTILKDSNVV